jgi:hypothetical protein
VSHETETVLRRLDSIRDTTNYTANEVHEGRRIDARILHLLEQGRPTPFLKFVAFFTIKGNTLMASITAPNITSTLAFVLNGVTPTGDTFAEPTVVVTTGTGTVALQPSVQGAGGAFTTAGTFTAGPGFLGSVVLSAEVAGVDDQDCSFSVVSAPETVAFDPTKFVAT